MQAGVIVARMRATLLDPDGLYWSDAELYDYLSAAQTAVASLKPDAFALTAEVTLVPGVPQRIPDDGAQLLDVTRNVNGQAIREIDRAVLSHAQPNWAGAAPSGTILHFMADARNPLLFHVYPPALAGGSAPVVEVVYAGIPSAVGAATDELALPRVYESALYSYAVALAYAKNTDRGDLVKYQGFMSQFHQLVAGRSQAQFAEAPRMEGA